MFANQPSSSVLRHHLRVREGCLAETEHQPERCPAAHSRSVLVPRSAGTATVVEDTRTEPGAAVGWRLAPEEVHTAAAEAALEAALEAAVLELLAGS